MEFRRKDLVRALAHIDSRYRLASVKPLGGRAFVVAVRTRDQAGERLILLSHSQRDRQRNPDIAWDEFRLLKRLKGAGLPVARPLYLDRDHAPPFLITAWLPGSARFAADNMLAFCQRLASILSEIHAVDLGQRDLSFLPRQAERVADYLVATLPTEERIQRAMRRAADRVKPNASALLHGDFWPGNLLWRGEALSGIIDWEDAVLGDPLGDLGKSRLEMLWALGEAAMGEYTAQYLALNPQLDAGALPFWDLWSAARLPHYASFARDPGRVAVMGRQYDSFVQAAIEALGG